MIGRVRAGLAGGALLLCLLIAGCGSSGIEESGDKTAAEVDASGPVEGKLAHGLGVLVARLPGGVHLLPGTSPCGPCLMGAGADAGEALWATRRPPKSTQAALS